MAGIGLSPGGCCCGGGGTPCDFGCVLDPKDYTATFYDNIGKTTTTITLTYYSTPVQTGASPNTEYWNWVGTGTFTVVGGTRAFRVFMNCQKPCFGLMTANTVAVLDGSIYNPCNLLLMDYTCDPLHIHLRNYYPDGSQTDPLCPGYNGVYRTYDLYIDP